MLACEIYFFNGETENREVGQGISGIGCALKTNRRMSRESRHAATFLSALLKSLLKELHLTVFSVEIRMEDRRSLA